MKIGILTYHCVPNFGAQLQALSTVAYLRRIGHDPIVLNWYPVALERIYSDGRVSESQISCHNEFTLRNLPVSSLCRTENELIDEINRLELDAIVFGSDAIFKCHFLKEYNDSSSRFFERIEGNPFFGDFLLKLNHHVPASVYAASSQDSAYKTMSGLERKTLKRLCDSFNVITTRDDWTRKMVKYITGRRDVRVLPDPVFGFNENIRGQVSIPSREEVLARYGLQGQYVLMSFRERFANREYVKTIADELLRRGIQPAALPMPEGIFDCGIDKTIDLPLDPLVWYALICHSSGYIGERMHPIIVCLHNGIPFFSFDEYGRMAFRYFARKSFWIRKYYRDWRSSKTYHILNKAEMLDNWYSYHMQTTLPSPAVVVDRLLSFDIEKCKRFSIKENNEYQQGMSYVLRSLVLTRS